MKCRCPLHSAFRRAEYPRDSIFMDGKLTIGAASGKTQSQIQSEATAKVIERTGKSPGTITGTFSAAANRAAEERLYQRRARG